MIITSLNIDFTNIYGKINAKFLQKIKIFYKYYLTYDLENNKIEVLSYVYDDD